MMNKSKTSWLLSAKYLLVVPVGAALMLGNAIQASPNPMEVLSEMTTVQSNSMDGIGKEITEPQQPAKTMETPPVKTSDDKRYPFVSVEQMPQYPGGTRAMKQYITENLKYPEQALKDGIQGRVVVRFVVDKDGTIKDAQVVRGLSPETDKEALRVVNAMPKWTPGKQNGQAVPVYYTLPVMYKLGKSKAYIQ